MRRVILVGTVLGLLILAVPVTRHLAQQSGVVATPSPSKMIKPVAWVTPEVQERTWEQIDAAATAPAAAETAVVPFRSTLGDAEYARLKAIANAPTGMEKPKFENPVPLHGVTGATAYVGGNQGDNGSVGQPGWVPPDTEGTIGASQFVETENNYINVYSKTGALLKHTSLTAFMGSSTNTFDSRVLWDNLWQRWVVTSDSFATGSGAQIFWEAISKTSSATGTWWIYTIDAHGLTGGGFWDYPSVGLQQDSIIFTANVFGGSHPGAWTYSVSKAQNYNGHTQGFAVFGGLIGTLQPPNIITTDLTGFAWLAAAPGGSGAIDLYAMENPSSPNNTLLFGPYAATGVAAYSLPPNAAQPSPCTAATDVLDSLDNRFQNASTQNGDNLYQVHAVAVGSFPAVRYYVLSGLSSFAPAVAESGTFWASATSYDWNPSIASDSAGEIVITWSSTDPTPGTNAQVRYVGKQSGDPVITGAVGSALITSGTCLTTSYDPNFGHQRWGDYSFVTVDPKTAKTFWIINEDILVTGSSNQWGSEFGKVHF